VVDDFILIKSDGFPTYNFAHVIDDSESKISHVIRSQEFLSSVPKFLNLYEALDIERPKLATLPYVLGQDGKKKLSKRDGAKDILDYKREGYLPEALVSFLATLGWNDGTTQEIYTKEELIEKFSLSRVQRHGAKFDEERLKWINGKMIRSLNARELDKLLDQMDQYWPPSAKNSALYFRREVLRFILQSLQDKVKTLSEIGQLADSFFNEDYTLDINLLKSSARSLGDPKGVLEATKKELEQSDFTPEDLEKRLRNLVKHFNAQPKDVFGFIRVAITGKTIAPGLWSLLSVIGRDSALARINRGLAALDV
jgi:glutamyl/glutaminyl-tRNA synthetase